MGQKRFQNGVFQKFLFGNLGCSNTCFSPCFEPVAARFGPWYIAQYLENGLFWDQRWVKHGSKAFFRIGKPTPFGMLKQLFLACFEPVVTHYGPWKIPKCNENGPFWAQTWLKKGSTMRFSKSHDAPFGMLKQVFFAKFEPVVTHYGPWRIPKCLENGPFWDQTWVKKGSKMLFPKSFDAPFGMLIQALFARFEPVVTHYGPWKIPKCLENGLFWDQSWVKKGSKTRVSKTYDGPFGLLKQAF
jgi:hypothetical protein